MSRDSSHEQKIASLRLKEPSTAHTGTVFISQLIPYRLKGSRPSIHDSAGDGSLGAPDDALCPSPRVLRARPGDSPVPLGSISFVDILRASALHMLHKYTNLRLVKMGESSQSLEREVSSIRSSVKSSFVNI